MITSLIIHEICGISVIFESRLHRFAKVLFNGPLRRRSSRWLPLPADGRPPFRGSGSNGTESSMQQRPKAGWLSPSRVVYSGVGWGAVLRTKPVSDRGALKAVQTSGKFLQSSRSWRQRQMAGMGGFRLFLLGPRAAGPARQVALSWHQRQGLELLTGSAEASEMID
jgi:hypothetical protein